MTPPDPNPRDPAERTRAALEKLCKWRSVMAGWIAGSKTIDQGGAQGLRDLADKWLIMRCEVTALSQLAMAKGLFTQAEFTAQVGEEARLLDAALERVFDGFQTAPFGLVVRDVGAVQDMMRRLGFPE